MIIEGKVENMNIGDNFFNCNVITATQQRYNIKLSEQQAKEIKIDRVYAFKVEQTTHNDRTLYHLISYDDLLEAINDPAELKEKLAQYYSFSEIPIAEIKAGVESYLAKIENKIVQEVTTVLYKRYQNKFYIYPAAVRFHHAYIGGLSHHTLTMLKIAEGLLEIYPYINKDLVYGGIILHDLCKVCELSGFEGGEYTKEGQLIGHLVMISQKLVIEAEKLGYRDSEEILMLNHILLSHHGIPNFGAARRPQTAEALLVWYIDTIDSKFEELGQQLAKTDEGSFSSAVSVADKLRFYKHRVK
jgi:3'-5' exoribonuclease